jgi:DNA-binding MarR family transcriptional regulator
MRKDHHGQLRIPEDDVQTYIRAFGSEFDPTSMQLLFVLRALAQRVNDRASEWLAPMGLTATQFNYLAVVYARGTKGVTVKDLSALLHTTNGSVATMLNGLERDRLVKRVENPSDGRSMLVYLSSKGKRLFETAFRRHHQHIDETLASLPRPRRAALLDLLTELGDQFIQPPKIGAAKLGTRSRR